MSKAFTRESDDSGDEEVSLTRPPLPPGTVNYITREGAERLQQRLNELIDRKVRLTALPNETGLEQRKIESNIRALRQTLNSIVVAQAPPNKDKVAFGATVGIRQPGGEEETYRIVGVDEAEPDNNLISWLSPLARALVSRRVGDKVQFRAPDGLREMTILNIGY